LAGEAVVDDAVLMVVIKSITQRLRPTDIAASGNYSDTFFQGSKSPIGKGTSFPSGHALMSFPWPRCLRGVTTSIDGFPTSHTL
jgi:membrane-associated phospholipid phosphatase